ncbi:MAG TPA: polyprenyl diphosphate synthase [Candidatus Norongarragalinales archaeon]|nr:polyprenyl diphosphate synthase [Candidatus Norongarragalinales archaeon]
MTSRVGVMKPKSIAIIPDGNRRFASKGNLSVQNAYSAGFRKVEEVLKWAKGAGISNITFWALSLENYNRRSRLELRILFALMRRKLRQSIRDKTFEKRKVRVEFFGKLELLPKDLQDMFTELEESTSRFKNTLGIALAYSGREEIVTATKKILVDFYGKGNTAQKVAGLTEKDFEKYLYSPDSPDLIIRTGGVSRLSGFLPWQTAYSELYFSQKLWPEFDENDFKDALEFYEHTERRFGR